MTDALPVIMPLPERDFDPTEAAITWKVVHDAGYKVEFATPNGKPARGDEMMLTGEGLDPWGWVPLLKKVRVIGLALRANSRGRTAYREMLQNKDFQHPHSYSKLQPESFGAMILPGGHAAGIRPYLEDKLLQEFVANFFDSKDQQEMHRPVAAICHGVVLLARSISDKTGKSVLYGRKTTALTWKQEKAAWTLTRYFARFWDPNYYRTYMEQAGDPPGYWGVEQEVKRSLASDEDFVDVPNTAPQYLLKTSNLARDTLENSTPAWVVQDGNYLSARWPGDAHTLAQRLVQLMHKPS